MKQLMPLLFLYFIVFDAPADVTLSYKTFIDKNGSQNLTYSVKNGILRLTENQSERINLYNQSKQIFLSIDQKNANISRIDKNILNKRIEQLNQQRLSKLAEVETGLNKKLQDMSDKEKEIATELVNQLKYPEFYGAHTQIKVIKTAQTKTINEITCDVYDIKRNDSLVKQVCMASRKSLGISPGDYEALRDFHRFNYNTQTRLMLAMGKTDFIEIDYQMENMDGLPLEIITISDNKPTVELLIDSITTKRLDQAYFDIPNSQN
ncbi:MAG: hypothetical protein OQL06_11615 [Gammaproteobacteria bacterium]|nr:hypothetical protein [Gammaproteobacteria bacterium]